MTKIKVEPANGESLSNCSFMDKGKIETLALGGFDGLHLGHRALMDRLGEKGALLVIEHNRVCLTPGCFRERFSRHPIFICPLESVRKNSPEHFIDRLQQEFPNLKSIVVGYDFKFGRDRAAGTKDLRKLFKGETVVVPKVSFGKTAVHATWIRSLVIEGHVAHAARLLGRPHLIEGDIVRGQGVGARELFPTINLDVRQFVVPKEGVYATKTEIGGALYPSVSFIGKRLSTDGAFAIETHVIDTENNADFTDYKKVVIWFIDRIRDNKAFSDLSLLKDQIACDIKKAVFILRKYDESLD